jgi:THO complex subunit 4
VESVNLVYDRAGRSNGTAFIVYPHIADARSAIREFDGANAKGQPIRLELLPPTAPAAGRSEPRLRRDNPFDRVENPKSLFDRVEAPTGRDRRARSASPGEDRGYGGRRGGGLGGRGPASRDRRSDISKPAPDGIDRYVPGQDDRRSSSRRGYGPREGGRRPGERRERGGERAPRDGRDNDGHKLVNGRPRKTQEELDAEMDDYWGSSGAANGAASTNGVAPPTSNAPAVQVTAVGDEDTDMIE